MDRLAFEAELRREGYRVVNSSVKPNLCVDDHVHDFDAKVMVLGGEIAITRNGKADTFRAGQWCEVPANCTHAEKIGPEGVALLSGRRRHGPVTREGFEEDLRREGWDVRYGGQKPGHTADSHAHEFDARLFVLGGEITLIRDGKPQTFRPGDCCEVPAGTLHAEQVGPEGVSVLAGIRQPIA